mmetsp:Transcript_116997/g.162617  ORF Transcript_116997/g.162617 Transcript_116997/m.162617 type:complete len:90 (+) Transcript_116997:943-1212(+)|eukprot:scaffold258396_cov24-Tisochrysis_lutea.AAC.1
MLCAGEAETVRKPFSPHLAAEAMAGIFSQAVRRTARAICPTREPESAWMHYLRTSQLPQATQTRLLPVRVIPSRVCWEFLSSCRATRRA